MTNPADCDLETRAHQLSSVHSEDAAIRYAAQVIRRAARNNSPMITDGALDTWLELWEDGLRPALVTASVAQQHDISEMARAALRLTGHLTGPDLKLRPGLRVAVGDQLTVIADYRAGQPDFVLKGGLLQVTAVDPGRQSVIVDIPTVGEQREITAASPLARRVEHAYATTRGAEHEIARSGAAREPAQGLSW